MKLRVYIFVFIILCTLSSEKYFFAKNYFDKSFLSDDMLYVDSPLTASDLRGLREHRITFIHASKNAPPSIFGSQITFPNLKRVVVVDPIGDIEPFMQLLSHNYPDISELTLSQSSKTVSNEHLKLISKFERLKYLHLDLRILDDASLADCIPQDVTSLTLDGFELQGRKFPVLSKLKTLRVWHGFVNGDLLISIGARHLTHLEINGQVSKDLFPVIAGFKDLQFVSFQNAILSKGDFTLLSRAGIKRLLCRHE